MHVQRNDWTLNNAAIVYIIIVARMNVAVYIIITRMNVVDNLNSV